MSARVPSYSSSEKPSRSPRFKLNSRFLGYGLGYAQRRCRPLLASPDGNRPRLVARSSADPKTVDFEFADISGSTKPVYLQHFVFTIVSADHHTEDSTFKLPEEKQLHAHFDLKRATESTPTRAGKARARSH